MGRPTLRRMNSEPIFQMDTPKVSRMTKFTNPPSISEIKGSQLKSLVTQDFMNPELTMRKWNSESTQIMSEGSYQSSPFKKI